MRLAREEGTAVPITEIFHASLDGKLTVDAATSSPVQCPVKVGDSEERLQIATTERRAHAVKSIGDR